MIVVAGGGTAGCVVAARLAEAGRDVLLIEAGPDYGPMAKWPADLLDATSLPTSHDWGYFGHGAAGQPLGYDRARVLGGCSAHNGCTQTVGWAGDYDAWDSPGWDSASLRPLFAAAAQQMGLRSWKPEEIQPFQQAFLDGCAATGVPVRNDLDDLDGAVGAGCAPVNIHDGVRANTAFRYLEPVRAKLQILPDAVVDRVVIDHGRARAVEVITAGGRVTVAADEIVLCAGAYGSPEILLRSGIGPADHLRSIGVPAAADLPGVGENLHDHPAAQLEFAATADLAHDLAEFARHRALPEEQALAKLRSPHCTGPYDLHVYPWIEPDPTLDTGWRCVLPVSQLRPVSRGRVRLRSADPAVRAEVDPGFFSDPDGADLSSVAYGVTWVLEELLPSGFGKLLGRELTDAASSHDLPDWIRRTHRHYWHPAGSCRMGPADDGAVVDHEARVHGVAGVRVADASVFPTIPRATPALPTVVVGERVAQLMLR
ncbi:GMC family oxidoreductase [Amycolatopsis jejuensis]|uniref:GMC family oxidoreductase n=1 Tax=Amycolatopsis jejuensis TaxID=330084 RepID=UPI00052408F6|nr:GMC family oxidoreductase [Amycolatopsis jejuensis]